MYLLTRQINTLLLMMLTLLVRSLCVQSSAVVYIQEASCVSCVPVCFHGNVVSLLEPVSVCVCAQYVDYHGFIQPLSSTLVSEFGTTSSSCPPGGGLRLSAGGQTSSLVGLIAVFFHVSSNFSPPPPSHQLMIITD